MSYKQSYFDLQTLNDKNLPLFFSKIMDVCDFLYQRYLSYKENNPGLDENDNKVLEDDSGIYTLSLNHFIKN